MVLNAYNQLRNKKEATNLFKSYKDYCQYCCQSLYDFIETVDNNSWITALKINGEKLGKNIEVLKQNFIGLCNNAKTYIIDSVAPAFHGFYQKCIDSMILINNRTYTELINKIFDSDLPNITTTIS